jgi:hypothetical protein
LSACAGSVASIRPDRPPLPDAEAIEELVLVCQPTANEERPCSPTRIQVEVCGSDLEEGCKVRSGIHDLVSELDAYDDYVAELRGDEVLEAP